MELRSKLLGFLLCVVATIAVLCLPAIMQAFLGGHDINEVNNWINFLGHLHPVALHLPIGGLVIICMLEGIAIVGRLFNRSMPSIGDMTIPLFCNALTAVGTCILGLLWLHGGEMGEPGQKMTDHMWQGLIFTACAIWLPLIYNMCNKAKPILYQIALGGTVLVMTSASHIGGVLVHGDPLDKAPWAKKDGDSIEQEADPIFYSAYVKPIFESKCYSCHHSTKKIKAGFKMDTLESILEGGDTQDISPALTPGDVQNSFLITSIELPIDDDLHMPPENKAQITPDELDILKFWVESGASGTMRLSQIEGAEEVVQASRTSDKVVHKTQTDTSASSVTPQNSPLRDEVKKFNEKYPNSLSWSSMSASTLEFAATSFGTAFSDKDLGALEPFKTELRELNMNSTGVTDEVQNLIKKCTHLEVIKLSQTEITDDLLRGISTHPNLEVIVLHSTNVSDEGLAYLKSLKTLQKLYLWNTQCSSEGVGELLKSLPECEVITD